VWHTIFTIFKEKGEEGQTKKIICKKNGKKEKQVAGAHRHAQERIEKEFFLDFVILLFFFGFFVFIFAVRCLKISDFVSFHSLATQYTTYPVLTGTTFYPLFKGKDTALFNFSIYHVFIKQRTKYTVRYRTLNISLLNITVYYITV
jgi:hypothetical protein